MIEKISYSAQLEELAYGKKASALRSAADALAQPGQAFEAFFEAGEKLAALRRAACDCPCHEPGRQMRHCFPCCEGVPVCRYFKLHGSEDYLLFFGREEDILERVRSLPDRDSDLSPDGDATEL